MKKKDQKELEKISRKGESVLRDAQSLLSEKGKETMAGLERAVGDLSEKISAYKKHLKTDEGKKQALQAVGIAAAVVAAIVGVKRIVDKRREE